MNLNIDSKIPQSFSELKNDSVFCKLMQICQKDMHYISNRERYYAYGTKDFSTCFFLPYRMQLAYIIFLVLNVYCLHWDLRDVMLPVLNVSVNLYPFIQVCVFIISIIVCLLNFMCDWKEYAVVSILNIAVIIVTWRLVFNDAPYFDTIVLSTALQIILTVIHSFLKMIITRKRFKEYDLLFKENHEQNEEAENFYNEAIKEIEEKWGVMSSRVWWGDNDFKHTLTSGKDFLEDHFYVYGLTNYKKYDYYNPMEKSYVRGTEIDSYEKCYTKKYIIHQVPEALRKEVQKNIKQENFSPLYPIDIDLAFLGNGRILAIECKCSATYYQEHKDNSISSTAPSQSDIDEARTRIDQKYDDKERIHNLFESGVDCTTDEMIDRKGLTNELWEESEISRQLREREVDNYIRNNTKTEPKSYSRKSDNTKTYSEIFMYIVNGYVFYNSSPDAYKKDEKGIWADTGFVFESSESNNNYDSYINSVEAAVSFLMKNDFEFSQTIVKRLLCDNSRLASKVMHTYALLNSEEYN